MWKTPANSQSLIPLSQISHVTWIKSKIILRLLEITAFTLDGVKVVMYQHGCTHHGKWEGRGQARSICNRVNYFQVVVYPTADECFEHMTNDYDGVDTHEKACLLNIQAWLDMTNHDIELAPAPFNFNFTPHGRNIYHKTPFKFSKPKYHEMTLNRSLITVGHAYF